MTKDLSNTIAQWTRIGAGFNVRPSRKTPDLERLILKTAEVVTHEPTLLTLSVTWLATYPEFVAKHRLAALVDQSSDSQHHAELGLILSLVREFADTPAFDRTIDLCKPAQAARPLFEIQQSNPVWAQIAESEASVLAKHWGLWCQPIDLKQDAIRPADWIVQRNPTFFDRAVLRGDLRLSILATLRDDPDTGRSELALSRACGAQRTAVRDALIALERACYVERSEKGNRSVITLSESKPVTSAA